MKKLLLTASVMLFNSILFAQIADEQKYLLTSKTNTYGFDILNLIDPYLSPLTYSGDGIQYEHESRRFLSLTNTDLSIQNKLNIDAAVLLNPAGTSSMTFAAFDYSWGMHYHYKPLKGLLLMGGGTWDINLGYKEIARNVNNPANADLATNLNLSGIALYDIPFAKRILKLQLTLETPVIGWMFVPLQGESYYEMFELGNLSKISHVSSIINRRGINPKLTLDIPFKSSIWQVGLKYQTLRYSANDMVFNRNEFTLLIGTTFDMIKFGGWKRISPKNFISPNE